jgi:hypothetical protein
VYSTAVHLRAWETEPPVAKTKIRLERPADARLRYRTRDLRVLKPNRRPLPAGDDEGRQDQRTTAGTGPGARHDQHVLIKKTLRVRHALSSYE